MSEIPYKYKLESVGKPTNGDCEGPLSTILDPPQPIQYVEVVTSEPNPITRRGMRFKVTVCPQLRQNGTCGRIDEQVNCIANVPSISVDKIEIFFPRSYCRRPN